MAPSKAHKHFNKFTGWARREGMVLIEQPEAMEEFFIDPARVPEEDRQLVGALFMDWFLLERRLTRCGLTPLELFVKTNGRRFDKAEAAVYRGFQTGSRFGIFKLTARKAGEWLDLAPIPRGDVCRVLDVKASEDGREGDFLIARLFPFQDHWTLSSFASRLDGEGGYHLERFLNARGDELKDGAIRHRFILGMFLPEVDWEQEGLMRVRARLAAILQRWRATDLTVSQIEEDILAAHAQKAMLHPLAEVVLSKAPSSDAANDVIPLLQALWNLTLPGDVVPPGPRESSLMGDLQRFVMDRLTPEETTSGDFKPRVREIIREWLAAPQKELSGQSPLDVIRDERRSSGNPNLDVGYDLQMMKLERSEEESHGAELVDRATDLLKAGKASDALGLLKEAYPSVKDSPEAFRVLGNMATANVMLGNRVEALEMLAAALKANPDYTVARNNLRLLKSLTPKEFDRLHRRGDFLKAIVVKER